ncbi:MAG TPA: serine/threonine-protein kinase, partial [Gemmatimonadales bacterium]|nr:serine/threonine-protein kinase [Gemmatimonadales bacterium]
MTTDPLRSSAVPTRATESRAVFERGLDTTSGLGFVRERLALLGKTLFLVSFGFYLFLLASLTLIGGAPFVAVVRGPVALGHLCASLTMALLWLLAGRARLSLWSLGALDAVSFVVAGGFLSLMTIEDEGQILQVLLALTVTVMVRAILLPSRPGRTMLLSALVFAPTVVVCIARHHPTAILPGFSPSYQKLHMTLNTVLWSVLGTTLATIVSQVLYGLRRQVAEATELGQYLLEEKIGGGGMGEVWRARHRLLIRPAAIKLIRQRAMGAMSGDPELQVRRFEREARATAALTSPHTVQLYDFGVAEDGRLYYVMELLDGLDLETLVRQHGPLPAERVVHLLRQVCAALQDAHGNGLVHRDIKPANVVVSRAGTTFDFVKVLDFGLVRLDSARDAGKDAINLSAEGSWSGTPGYMAPEVVLGGADTDHRVDLYALGCVAYWLLTGMLVFEAENAMQMMLQHVQAQPKRPSERVDRPVPAAL